MALSMFARNAACTNRLFCQQVMKVASQAALTQSPRLSSATKSVFSTAGIKSTTTPLVDAIRHFRTSTVHRSGVGHDHSKLWVIEKSVTVAMLAAIPLGLLYPNKILDSITAILITAHSFWGLEAIAVDYARAAVVGPFLAKLSVALVYLVSFVTLGGLFYLISHDVGISNAIRQLWAVKSQNA